MGYFILEKSHLNGEVKISGAKNAALPILAASLLVDDGLEIKNVPDLLDVRTMIEILKTIGKSVKFENNIVKISGDVKNKVVPYDLVRKMRASFNVLGPLVLKLGEGQVSLPGGCAIGVRPVDFHIMGLKKLGFEIDIEHGEVFAKKENCEKEVIINLPFPSVGATEHLMTTASLLNGVKVTIENAAMEPEVVDLQNFLNKMGAIITGAGTRKIFIKGVKKLRGGSYTVVPDRIEAGTYALSIAATFGEGLVKNIVPEHLEVLWEVLKETGTDVKIFDKSVYVNGKNKKKAININVQPYPGFPTDLQPQIMVYLSVAHGTSMIIENVFKNRFHHVDELVRMGAKIKVIDGTAIIEGVEKLSGAKVEGTDLRATAALIIAGFMADGVTEVHNDFHVLRGYENIIPKFEGIGGKIKHLR
ncbi:UDP-N-acetylglucosamine 1-carboxyvinyltransferase [Thermosipho melanesiensis]|uniref:UDP-N-acetylglucosamine 1-carboxyvinyltransferase n=1 Tax=Thermosipho melanesiensis TaxID=46541 RepID=A0ABM6GFA8_9BACT|nr:UDP-N-acetylglucosamine 1-carboxyvinyltransferase [Thermosipho melanesiensis]APT74225.1 UDP-N-acetylglucosamine 1-carboxyvinyltransferase [Thermosipho melanesiensis]OOC36790.1 UDP-N-acetylglucosamine 1-carboxyvinyltransferase [Thermosipho melanesiensis]OOC37327.1 UDP-N-acetylglucosamine 1-carboxyvinyltransferase [Thermosipho melanesiensis]OOC38079.1 UDP-N-acetylglucosamine 1-carboxyvinyltransferase [Thermosipho melanesiensis]OOC41308.1 UDP-N-acetylglucosamine 1-carboxyvinyltransferase [Ther